jgi:hypothetical protein
VLALSRLGLEHGLPTRPAPIAALSVDERVPCGGDHESIELAWILEK